METERLVKQFSPLLIDITNNFFNDQGDIRVTKGDSSVDSKIEVDPVVVDTKVDSKADPVVVESEVGPVVVGNNERYQEKPTGKAYQSKSKKKKRRNQRQWNNNKKKIRWKDQQPHVPSFIDHLLPSEGVPTNVAKVMNSIRDRARAHEIEKNDGSIQVEDTSSDTDDDEDDTDNDDDKQTSYGETINNDFNAQVGYEEGGTGVTIEYDGILETQYCHYKDIYYEPCEIYGDDPEATDEAIEMMANSTRSWSLCDGTPPLQDHPILNLG